MKKRLLVLRPAASDSIEGVWTPNPTGGKMARGGIRHKSKDKDNSMGSTLAAMAMSAFAMGAP
ncbi:MAG: hypothetical protein ACLP4V_30525, partial [Methylocella sp.]